MMRQTQLSEFFKVSGTPKSAMKLNKRKSDLMKAGSPSKVQRVSTTRRLTKKSTKTEITSSQSTLNITIKEETSIAEIKVEEEILSQYNVEEDELSLSLEEVKPNEFDLETIYAEKKFEIEYGSLITTLSDDVKNLKCMHNKHVERLFTAIVDVFSVPMNCVYFDKSELSLVRRMLTMSDDAQILLARLLKWKAGWHRIKKISAQLEMNVSDEALNELVDNGFFCCDYKIEEIQVLLDILLVDELKEVCKRMKVPHTVNKQKMINELLKIDSKKKSMFIGMKTPSEALKQVINDTVGQCVRISDNCWNLIKRIITLLYPIQNADESFTDVFHMLNEVFYENRIYPEMPKDRFPIFRDRQHLIDYSEAKNALIKITDAGMSKKWDVVRDLGNLAYEKLELFLQSHANVNHKCQLPSHVRRFNAIYVWVKILWKSIEAFKKDHDEGIKTATKFLRTLIENTGKIQGRFGRWYSELALIEMTYNKDLEASVILTEKALTQERLSSADAAQMLDRARKLSCRKTGISAESKERMKKLIEDHHAKYSCESAKEVTVEATQMEHGIAPGSKSTWRLDDGKTREYMSVELVAMKYYKNNEGFNRGIHCEGRLPVTLFACLFWDEIYTLPVPGAFVCPYQIAPLDLFGSQFVNNRREKIEEKMEFISNMDIDSLCDIILYQFITCREYFSLINSNLVEESEDFKEIVICLGTKAVVGICRMLADNYCEWSAGFPDLLMWNPSNLTCKVVEVKGPGDTLSVKQKLWIKNLLRLGVQTEVCHVKSKHG